MAQWLRGLRRERRETDASLRRQVREQFSGRQLSLLLTWTTAQYAFILHRAAALSLQQVVVLLFYTTLTPVLLAILAATAVLRVWIAARRGAALEPDPVEGIAELLSHRFPQSIVPLFLGGMAAPLLLVPALAIRGIPFGTPDADLVLEQVLIVAPNETYVFLLFLPALLPARVFFLPGWLWAQVLFGAFHYVAYGLDPVAMTTAVVVGAVWFQFKDAGRTHAFLGLPFVLGFHAMWNVVSVSAGGAGSGQALTDAFALLGVPAAFAVGGLYIRRPLPPPGTAKHQTSNVGPRGNLVGQGLVLPRVHGRGGCDRGMDARAELREVAGARAAGLRRREDSSAEGPGDPQRHGDMRRTAA